MIHSYAADYDVPSDVPSSLGASSLVDILAIPKRMPESTIQNDKYDMKCTIEIKPTALPKCQPCLKIVQDDAVKNEPKKNLKSEL